jgi:hypothetical protein
MFVEDAEFRFTRSKDSKTIYAIRKGWKTGEISIGNIVPRPGSKIIMLGIPKELAWETDGNGLFIDVPGGMKTPCTHSYVFKIAQP